MKRSDDSLGWVSLRQLAKGGWRKANFIIDLALFKTAVRRGKMNKKHKHQRRWREVQDKEKKRAVQRKL